MAIVSIALNKVEPWAVDIRVGDDSGASCGESRIDWGPVLVTIRLTRLIPALHRLVTGKSRSEWL